MQERRDYSMKAFFKEHGWKVASTLFILGCVYATLQAQLGDHEKRIGDVEKGTKESHDFMIRQDGLNQRLIKFLDRQDDLSQRQDR